MTAPTFRSASTMGILGAGVMGETILSGLLRSGRHPAEIVVAEKRPERADELTRTYGVRVDSDPAVVAAASTVILAVKPQDLGEVLTELAPVLRPRQLLISLAAGRTLDFIEARVPAGVAVVRVMPNTPALVNQGMAAVTRGTACTDAQLEEAEALMATTGRVIRIPEAQMDAVTAVSGSGPAYVFLIAEAMALAGERLGLPPEVGSELVRQTLLGAATMLCETDHSPATLRRQVTSKGGTTAAAIAELEDRGVPEAFLVAMTAARDRSIELATHR
ncbi:MAG: pyrroline-5-carboxylate reductase [Nocardioides sp.]